MKTPNNWIEIKIVDLCKTISDGNYSSKYPHQSEFKKEGIPFIRANNFKNNTIIQKDLKFISKEKHSILKKGHLKTNDVLITTRGDIGNLAIVPINFNDANINAQIVRLEPDSRLITPKFLLFALKSNYIRSQLVNNTTGTALKQLPVSKLKKVKILLPPLDQQNKIVEILEKAEKLKEKRREANKLADEYLKNLFLEMFGNVLVDSKGYGTKKIKSGIKNVKKIDPKEVFKNNKFKYIDIASIDRVKKVISTTNKITGLDAPSRARQEIFENDLLISTVRPNLNTVALVTKKLNGQICSTGFCVLRADNKIFLPEYLFYTSTMPYFINNLVTACSGANYPAVSNKQILEIDISAPSIKLQLKFAQEVQKINNIKENQKESEKEINNLFNSLMQKAFKGELIA
jgi:type I restriction enzyme, S subunit